MRLYVVRFLFCFLFLFPAVTDNQLYETAKVPGRALKSGGGFSVHLICLFVFCCCFMSEFRFLGDFF